MKIEANKLKKLWDNKKGQAVIKLSFWFLFFCIAIIVLLFNSPSTNHKNENQNQEQNEFLDFKVMWKNLEESNYSYEYIVKNKITNEILTYNGNVENGIDNGFRESKIGIIKYKIVENFQYQIIGDQEEPIENLYEEKDENYLTLFKLKLYFNRLTESEEKKDNLKILQYQNELETIKIKMNREKIHSIEIDTNEKNYELSFYEEK